MRHTHIPYLDRGDGHCRFCGETKGGCPWNQILWSEIILPDDYNHTSENHDFVMLDLEDIWKLNVHYPGCEHYFKVDAKTGSATYYFRDLDQSQARVALFEITGRDRWFSQLDKFYSAEKTRLDQEVLQYLIESGREGETVNGHILFPTSSLKASPKSGLADRLREEMERIGEGHLYKTSIMPATLSKWVRELPENPETLEPDIPESIRECLNIYEVRAVGLRKK